MRKNFKTKKEEIEERKRMMNSHMQNSNFGNIVVGSLENQVRSKNVIGVRLEDVYSSPSKWNFYDKLPEDKLIELMTSIEENGLLEPVIIWEMGFDVLELEYNDEKDKYEFTGAKYCILSGHNRCRAYNRLYELTGDSKYLIIPSFIFAESELSITQAKEIVIDSNYVQRVLNTKEKVKSVMYKYTEIEKNKTKKGRTRELVAEELGISPATVTQYLKLSTLIEEFQQLVYEEKINLTSVLKIADKTQETQKWIYETYGDVLSSKLLNKVKPYMKRNDIEKLFEKELEPKIKTKRITVEIPEDLEDRFRELVKNLLYREKNKE